MKEFRIHFTVNGVEDYFTVEGKDMDEVRAITEQGLESRNLTEKDNNLWSEPMN